MDVYQKHDHDGKRDQKELQSVDGFFFHVHHLESDLMDD
jgi:hypothetical protein